MGWFSTEKDGLPMTREDGYSKSYPVKVKHAEGWRVGRYYVSAHSQKWSIEGFHGEWEVTDWFNLPDPPEE